MEFERASKKRGAGKSVLVVDDSPAIRKVVSAAFLSDGFAICGEAGNGREGIDVAKLTKPDVIILDFSMPVMNGLQAAPELRRILPNTPIVLFSLYADSSLAKQAFESGISLILSKTVSLPTLIDTAHALLSN